MNAFSAGKRHVFNAANVMHDVIRTANSFPYTYSAKSMFAGVKNNRTQQIRS